VDRPATISQQIPSISARKVRMYRQLSNWFARRHSRGQGVKAAPRPRRVRLGLEQLEDRVVPAVINVNSLADVLNPAPGVVTLRSAIQTANTDGDATNVINLTVAGTYKITLPGTPGETDNAAGEFAILPSAGNLTIQNTSGGKVVVDGNHLARVFDINPGNTNNPATKILVTLQGFTIQNGVAFDAANPDGPNASGGGIRDQGNASLTLNNMVVTNNLASADGGGISMENTVSTPWTLTVNNSVISNNHAGDAGGGIDTDGSGKVFVTSSTLTGNTTVNQGAAIWLDAIQVGTVFQTANLTMTADLVTSNSALNGPTGALGNAGNGIVTIISCTVANNFSGTTGGGFGDENGQGTLIVNNSLFLNNSAVGNGGGIQTSGPSTTITNSLIRGNSTTADGGGLFANGVTLTLLNSTVAGNTAAGNGGGIFLETTGTGAAGSTITNTTITGNSALNAGNANNGGGLDADSGFTGSLTLLNDTINANYATNGGGVFWAGNGTVNVENTIVALNFTATMGTDVNNPAGTFTDLGGNLIGVSGAGSGNTGFTAATTQTGTVANPLDPLLGPLQNNGGQTAGSPGNQQVVPTEALLRGSKAIGKGVLAGAPTSDERGFKRPGFGFTNPSAGAFEPQFLVPPAVTFIIGLDGQVYGRQVDTTGNPFGPYFLTAPGQVKSLQVARLGDVGYEIFVLGMDDQVYAQTFDLSGNPTSSYFLTNPGRVLSFNLANSFLPEVFAIGRDHQVYEEKFDATGAVASPYFLVASGQVQSFVAGSYGTFQEGFAIGQDSQVYAVTLDSNGNPTSTYFLTNPGRVKSISLSDSPLPEVFAIGQDRQVYAELFDSTGKVTSPYFLVAAGPVQSFVVGNFGTFQEGFAIGTDNQVHAVKLDTNGNPLGGYFLAQPGVVQAIALGNDGSGLPELFAQGLDAQVYGLSFDATGNVTGGYSLTSQGGVQTFVVR
jgi:hypothetical protein